MVYCAYDITYSRAMSATVSIEIDKARTIPFRSRRSRALAVGLSKPPSRGGVARESFGLESACDSGRPTDAVRCL
jgi:hypothetical protein